MNIARLKSPQFFNCTCYLPVSFLNFVIRLVIFVILVPCWMSFVRKHVH